MDTPEALDLPDATEQAAKYTEQLSKAEEAAKNLLVLAQEYAATQNTDQLNNYLKNAFPLPEVEQYNRELKTLESTIQTIQSQGTGLTAGQQVQQAFSQEKARIEEELQQVRDKVAQNTDATQEDILRAQEIALKHEKDMVEALQKQFDIKQKIAIANETINTLLQGQADMERMTAELAELQMVSRMRLEGFTQAEINLEVQKYRLAQKYQKLIKDRPEQEELLNDQLKKQLFLLDEIFKVQKDNADPLKQLMYQWKQDLKDVNAYYARMAQVVQQELGNAMSAALIGVIEGTQTVEEAFANMFKNIGKAFIDMATQMIAKALVMKALGILMPGGGGGSAMPFPGTMQGVNNMLGLLPFAEGGFVSSPTAALIGEGGEPEYVIPESKMNTAMQRWSGGNKGDSVLDPTSGNGSSMTNMQDEPFTPQITINGGVMEMDGQQYIRRDEIPSLVQQSAKAGEERAFRKMKMSPSTRRKIGI